MTPCYTKNFVAPEVLKRQGNWMVRFSIVLLQSCFGFKVMTLPVIFGLWVWRFI